LEYFDKVVYLAGHKIYTDIPTPSVLDVFSGFFQVNSHVFEKMSGKIKDWVGQDKNTILLDV
jgi:tRNA/tmRNA/rRNA uracil-C5-methylase (TrmA/RlmC/RlmD family)